MKNILICMNILKGDKNISISYNPLYILDIAGYIRHSGEQQECLLAEQGYMFMQALY